MAGMSDKIKSWSKAHKVSHVLLTVSNFAVMCLCAYHLSRFNGYGYYSFEHGDTSAKGVWDFADSDSTLSSVLLSKSQKEVIIQQCGIDTDTDGSISSADGDIFKNNEAENFVGATNFIEGANKVHIDIGNPIDQAIFVDEKKQASHFTVCIKFDLNGEHKPHPSATTCAILRHGSTGQTLHGNATSARKITLGLIVVSVLMFVFQVLYMIHFAQHAGAAEVLKNGKGETEDWKTTVMHNMLVFGWAAGDISIGDEAKFDKKEREKLKGMATFLRMVHAMFYIVTIVLCSMFISYTHMANNDSEPFDFKYSDTFKDGCYDNDFYTPAVELAAKKLKSHGDNTKESAELSAATAIVSANLALAVISGIIYVVMLSQGKQGTDSKKTKVVSDSTALGESTSEQEGAEEEVQAQQIGSRLAQKLYRRGAKIVNFHF